jgi:hypothetical protein
MTLDWSTTLGTTVILLILGYFLRKIDAKVDSSAKDINMIRLQMAGLSAEFQKNITDTFNEVCKERQNSCVVSQNFRFKSLEESDKHNCQKIDHLEKQRKEAWEEQKKWNDRVERKLFG